MGERFAYISRTLSYLDDGQELLRIGEDDVPTKFLAPVVVLGSPGMGKTRLMEKLGEQPGHRFIRATSFLRQPHTLLPASERLVIDGLDEVAAVAEGDPLHNVLSKLLECGKPPFIVSCRDAEWRGVTATLDISDEYGIEPKQLHLDPLSERDALGVLSEVFDRERAEKALRRLSDAGLAELYTNPLTLDFIAAIIEADGEIPDTRAELYAQATAQLRREQNERHRRSGLAALSEDAALDAAGAIMAFLLVTGHDAVTLGQPDPSAFAISELHDVGDANAIAAVIRSNLFRTETGSQDRFRPLHRTVAEFLGARWLARMVDRHGNPGRTAARLLALISSGHGIPSSLRGLAAWLPRFSPVRLGPSVITSDPYAILQYGDPDNLSPSQANEMLASLERLAKFDPHFRSNDWRRFAAKGLMQSAVKLKIKSILRSEDVPIQLRTTILDFIFQSRDMAEDCVDELTFLVINSKVSKVERSESIRILVNYKCAVDWKIILFQLMHFDDDDSPSLVVEAIARIGAASFEAEFIVQAVIAVTKVGLPGEHGSAMALGELMRLEQSIADPQIVELLDEFAKQLIPLRNPTERWAHDMHSGWREVASIVHKLVRRKLEVSPDSVTERQLWDWLRAVERDQDIDREDRNTISEIMSKDDRLRQGVQRLALFQQEPVDNFLLRHHYISRLSTGLELTDDDAKVHLAKLVERKDPAERDRWVSLVNRFRGSDKFIPKSVQSLALPYVGDDHQLLSFLTKKSPRMPADPWMQKHKRSIRDQKRRKLKRWQKMRDESSANLESIISGELGWILKPAQAYLGMFSDITADTPDQRLKEWLGDSLRVAVYQGFEAVLQRDDLPDVEQIAESYADRKTWYWIFPMLAAAGQRFLSGAHIEDLSPTTLISLALAVDHEAFVERTGFKEFPGFVVGALKRHPDQYERYLHLKFEPMLQARFTHVPGLHSFLRDPAERSRSLTWSAKWLSQFKGLPREVEEELADCLLYAGVVDRAEAWTALKTVMIERLSQCPQESKEAMYWRSVQFALDFEAAVAAIPAPDASTKHLIWSLSEHFYSRYSNAPKIAASVDQLQWLIRHFRCLWPHAERPSGVTTGNKNPWDASELLGWAIYEIAKRPDEEATAALYDLRSMPEDGYTELIQAAIAQQQRLLLETNFRPPLFADVKAVVQDSAPRTAEEVQAIIVDEIRSLQKRLRGDPFNVVNNFYNDDGNHKDENDCRNQMMIALGSLPYGIQFPPEAAMPQGNRSDSAFMFNGIAIPMEAKGQWHREVWTAPTKQLGDLYSIDFRASGKGIYVVFWFGNCAPLIRPPDGLALPTSPEEMEAQLHDGLPPDRRADIAVIVLNVSRSVKAPVPGRVSKVKSKVA